MKAQDLYKVTSYIFAGSMYTDDIFKLRADDIFAVIDCNVNLDDTIFFSALCKFGIVIIHPGFIKERCVRICS